MQKLGLSLLGGLLALFSSLAIAQESPTSLPPGVQTSSPSGPPPPMMPPVQNNTPATNASAQAPAKFIDSGGSLKSVEGGSQRVDPAQPFSPATMPRTGTGGMGAELPQTPTTSTPIPSSGPTPPTGPMSNQYPTMQPPPSMPTTQPPPGATSAAPMGR